VKPTRTLAILITAAAITIAAPGAAFAATSVPLPNSMASLGDSVTRAFNACGWYTDCPSRSFSTGNDTAVNSHYMRVKAANPAISDRNYNNARSGATIAELPGQAATAVSQGVEYVTILMGANDACTSTESGMTEVSAYRAQLDLALGKLKAGLPNTNVYLMSVPDIKRLWEIGKDNVTARLFWSVGKICQSMLANPTSSAPADVARRDRVRQRVIDFNAQLAQACAAYGAKCKFDGNAVFNYPFQFSQLSGWDFFHPNAEGQRVLAQVSYAAFGW
jgi:lysophospholipase L1-like esterase